MTDERTYNGVAISQADMERIASAYEAERARADAAEAQRDRLAAALEQYGFRDRAGLDDWHDSYCPHWDRRACRERCAKSRAALADVRDDRARRRDEAYRAMVEALQEMIDESGGEEPCIIERGYCRSHFGGINRGGNCPVPTANHALELARQVEEG